MYAVYNSQIIIQLLFPPFVGLFLVEFTLYSSYHFSFVEP